MSYYTQSYIFTFIFFFAALMGHATSIDTVPQTQNIGMVSTEWNDFQTASPSEGIPLMEVPKPTSSGDPGVRFPIKLPDARNEFTPELNVSYANEGGPTWLGNGWDLGVSSFTLDTRWGVPLYSTTKESEIYLFDGEQLGPVFHRAQEYDREAERVFVKRQELDFQKIIRHGNSPKNYWWEVADKDGTKHYYGGSPQTGYSKAHCLTTKTGNITTWQIAQSTDKYGNLISYSYQKIAEQGGENIYPSTIIYNGYRGSEGNYKVEFILKSKSGIDKRKDVTTNCRTGMKLVIADLLDEIKVSYKDEIIRTYKLKYQEGVFAKTLLSSIAEFDQKGALFYEYGFDYHNDIVKEAYTSAKAWDVPKDNIPIFSISGNIDLFKPRPTMLGGAKSTNGGFQGAVTVGPPFNPFTKDYSAGPNYSRTESETEGYLAFVDINGDGMPDKVWKEEDGLYFRPNLFHGDSPEEAFGIRRKIDGITSFSQGKGLDWSVGGEINLAPGFLMFFHEESTTTVSTYFADFNGDELIDIAHKGQVYFNHISPVGIPTFTSNSGDTPSIIYKGDDLEIEPFDPAAQAELEKQNPLLDVVRVWRAPYDGFVSINGDIQLIQDTSPEALAYELNDGVIAYVQREELNILIQPIAKDDFTAKPINLNNVAVETGDKIYFRLNSVADGRYDRVLWDPIITYENEDLTIVNADCLPKYQFQASKDFLPREAGEMYVPADGVITVSGLFKKPILSDTIALKITSPIDTMLVFTPSATHDGELLIEGIEVKTGDKIRFQIYAKTNVDWANIVWNPRVEYSSFDDGSAVIGLDGNPVISICPKVEYLGYFTQIKHPTPYVVAEDGLLNVEMKMINTLSSIIAPNVEGLNISMKTKGEVDSIKFLENEFFYNSQNGPLDSIHSTITKEVAKGDTLLIDIQREHFFFFNTQTKITLNGQETNATVGDYIVNNSEKTEGHYYRGWGQFTYNPAGDFLFSAMNLSDLQVDTTGLAGDTALVDTMTTTGGLEGANANPDMKLIVMTSDPKSLAWQGSDEFAYLDEMYMSATRRGRKNVSSNAGNPMGAGIDSPDLITKTNGNGGLGGLGIGPAEGSLGYTGVDTWTVKDIGDMNGDRFPDILDENRITYTSNKGGISSRKKTHNLATHEVFSYAWAGGLGRTPANSGAKNAGAAPGKGSNKSTSRTKQKGKSAMSKSTGANKSAKSSIGFGGSLSVDNDQTENTFLDINGDGLEDKITEDGKVRLNLGYDFGEEEDWNFKDITTGSATDLGGGIGVNISNGSIQAGVGVTSTTNWSKKMFIDVNDDALLDQLVWKQDSIFVSINAGNGFIGPKYWLVESGIEESYSLGESFNVAGTVCLEFLFFRVCINAGTYKGQGSSGVESSFQDVNGDGYVDFLRAKEDDANLSARYSNIGKTNFLKTIYMPSKGKMELDYNFVGNTYDVPFSKWVVTSVTVNDGVAGDGVDEFSRSFVYADGKYDRHERQFYGFGRVEEHHLIDGVPARKIVMAYDVDSYYTKGLNLSQKLLDGEDKLYKEVQNSYYLKDIESGILLPLEYEKFDNGMAFPALAETKTTFYEGLTEGLSTILTYEYDTVGNVVSILDVDQAGSTKRIDYTYTYDFDAYLLDGIVQEITKAGDAVLRETNFELDDVGNRIKISKRINDSEFAETDLTYDEYGNVLSLSKPTNHNGERLTYLNEYDDIEHQYLLKETDGYGYEKAYEYEYLFNQMTASTDINGHQTLYSHDERGRTSTITYPYEIEANIPYSIRYEYHPETNIPYAVAHHYDPEYGEDLDVISFEDALQRLIQTKVRAELVNENLSTYDAFIVSGIEEYDALGRVVTTYLQREEPLGNNTTYSPNKDAINPNKTSFDILDRTLTEEDTYGAKYSYQYSIGTNNQGVKSLKATLTNPLGNRATTFYNTRNDILAQELNGPDGPIWTNYIYDDFSQVIAILDPYGNETNYTYDLLGRRTTVKVPDAGLTELTYDQANNLIERVTATIRDVISADGSIRYSYDHERLVQIDYPKHFQNKVQIHYGSPQDSFNRAGRIWLQEDGTGGREYFFDANGNVTKTIRTVMVNRSKVFTYVSENEYDTWGRIQKMHYPDGEVVDYSYNKGGQLNGLSGVKAGKEYEYVTLAGYDKFADMTHLVHGNNALDVYIYDDKGRLAERQIYNGERVKLAHEKYKYDSLDNRIETVNPTPGLDAFGGTISENYTFDVLSRMSSAEGLWNDGEQSYSLFFDYDDLNNLTMKGQNHLVNGNQQTLTSRTFDYEYEDEDTPTRPSDVGGKSYHYDENGNLLLRNSQAIFNYDQNIFDEENRMIGSSNNGYISQYTYDAFGRRALKSHGESQGIFINGAPAGFLEHKTNYQVEVSPYFTVYEHEYRKHYFMGNSRLSTKIGTGVFQTALGNSPEITAGGIDYKSRMQQYEGSILDYYGSLRVPPGPPGLLALLGQPEINTNSLPNASNDNPYTVPPPNWPNIAPPDTTGPPGPPVFYEFAYLTNENVAAGYNFTSGAITKEVEQFTYHYDYTNSTQFVTDFVGNARQYALYFPSGEKWVSKTSTNDSTNYFYNGLALDHETGYYNMGDIYYDPETNIEISVDPVLQNFGQQTFLRRPEGNFYYEYAELEGTDASFDLEILNSERPDPFLANTTSIFELAGPDEDKVLSTDYFARKQKERRQKKKTKAQHKLVMKELKEKAATKQRNKKVLTEINEFKQAFDAQDPSSATEFTYSDYPSFVKAKSEEKKYKKRLAAKIQKRKARNKKRLKVRIK